MISRLQKLTDNVEKLELWLKAPLDNKPEMEEEMVEYLQRVQLAHTWMLKHGSFKKVIPMLVTHHRTNGKKTYSEATARRDIQDAQRLFHTVSADTARWMTGFMLDNLCELFDSAVRAHKHKEAAAIAAVMTKYIEMGQKYAQLDMERAEVPVPRLVQFAPEEAGVEYDPAILQEVEAWKKRREARRRGPGLSFTDAAEADAEPLQS